MPELPEVETICRGLMPLLLNQRFEDIILYRQTLRYPIAQRFSQQLKKLTVQQIQRRSKYILLGLEKEKILAIHLGMSGRLRVADDVVPLKHDHVFFKMSNNTALFYNDPRRFGFMEIIHNAHFESHPFFKLLGPEPFSSICTGDYLYEKFKSKIGPIKASLLDQRVIAGLGNIYVCEALFLANIHPQRESYSLSLGECQALMLAIKTVLKKAIAAGGSTLKDYAHPDGNMGYFQHSFQVYNQQGNSCGVCSRTIEQIRQGGRSTFFCPKCQV